MELDVSKDGWGGNQGSNDQNVLLFGGHIQPHQESRIDYQHQNLNSCERVGHLESHLIVMERLKQKRYTLQFADGRWGGGSSRTQV